MLVWINGPFGGGKTHVAAELQHRLLNSWVADPELVGLGLHRVQAPCVRGDFQDLAAWRIGVVEALDTTLRTFDGVVLAPMTVVSPEYFTEIIGTLRDKGHDVRHIALLASPETVRQRLRDRGFGRMTARLGVDPLARESFAVERIEPCLERLGQPEFAEHIWTDSLSITQVADKIGAYCGLALLPSTDGPLRTSIRRAGTTLRHMRW